MQGAPPPQQQIDGVWNQNPSQAQYQIPLQQGMEMGYYPATQATTALVLSILGIVMCSVCTAIPGVIMANNALKITNAMPNHPDAGSAKAAQIVGWIVIGMALVGVLAYAGMAVLFVALGEF